MMQVKFCGFTRIKDALLAEDLGVRYLGFIFAPSPRQIDIGSARSIVQSLQPQTRKVAVFKNASRLEIINTLDQTEMDCVQLHGQESLEDVQALRTLRPHVHIIKTIFENQIDPSRLNQYDSTLFEKSNSVNWEELSPSDIPRARWIAGDLGFSNLPTVLRKLKPLGVDLARGIEASPGIKDPYKMREMIQLLQIEDPHANPISPI